jgi:hypothetical protein
MNSLPKQSSDINEAAVRDALASNAGVRTLLRMAAAQSLMQNLEAEDEMVRRENDAYFSEIYGGSPNGNGSTAKAGESPMRVMAARDVVINQPQPTQPQATLPTPVPTEPPKKSTGLLPKLALGAALLGSGAALGGGIPWLLGAFDKSATSTTAGDTDTATVIEAFNEQEKTP